MKITPLFLAGALALSSISLLSAKSYSIVLGSNTQAGSATLPAGQYTLDVEGSNAVFTSVENGKKFTAPAKIEKTSQKFTKTTVHADQVDGAKRLITIDLGGTATKLRFSGE